MSDTQRQPIASSYVVPRGTITNRETDFNIFTGEPRGENGGLFTASLQFCAASESASVEQEERKRGSNTPATRMFWKSGAVGDSVAVWMVVAVVVVVSVAVVAVVAIRIAAFTHSTHRQQRWTRCNRLSRRHRVCGCSTPTLMPQRYVCGDDRTQ